MWVLSLIMAAYTGSGLYHMAYSKPVFSRRKTLVLGGFFLLWLFFETVRQFGPERGTALGVVLVMVSGPLVLLTVAVNKKFLGKAVLIGAATTICGGVFPLVMRGIL